MLAALRGGAASGRTSAAAAAAAAARAARLCRSPSAVVSSRALHTADIDRSQEVSEWNGVDQVQKFLEYQSIRNLVQVHA